MDGLAAALSDRTIHYHPKACNGCEERLRNNVGLFCVDGRKTLLTQSLDPHQLIKWGGSRCSDNRYSDNRAVGLGLISVFDHHGRKQLGLSTSSTKVFTLLLCQQSDLR